MLRGRCCFAVYCLLNLGLLGGGIASSKDSIRSVRPATVANSEVRQFRSRINGAAYELFVLLPSDYAGSSRRYPVFYLLDGNTYFTLARAMTDRLGLAKEIEEPIIVCIGYPGVNERSMDYSPIVVSPTVRAAPPDPGVPPPPPVGRGAANFLRVIREEIAPMIDRTYRTNPHDRGLGGHSLGGLFTTYALFHATDTFQRYWISSPSLVWDDEIALKYEADFARTHADLNARVYAGVGEIEPADMRDLLRQLGSRLTSRGYRSLRWKMAVAPGQPHSAVPIVTITDAFYTLYGKEIVSVDAARLAALTGRFRLPDGRVLVVRTDGRNLFVDHLPSYQATEVSDIKFQASSPRNFFVRFLGYELILPEQKSSTVDQFTLRAPNRADSVTVRMVEPDGGERQILP